MQESLQQHFKYIELYSVFHYFSPSLQSLIVISIVTTVVKYMYMSGNNTWNVNDPMLFIHPFAITIPIISNRSGRMVVLSEYQFEESNSYSRHCEEGRLFQLAIVYGKKEWRKNIRYDSSTIFGICTYLKKILRGVQNLIDFMLLYFYFRG